LKYQATDRLESTIEIAMTNIQSKTEPSVELQLAGISARLDSLCDLVQSEWDLYRVVDHSIAGLLNGRLVTVVIPVFNEKKTIGRVLGRVAALPFEKEIVVVDDFSTDGTRELLERLEGIPGLRLIAKPKNEGKGAALRTGFAEARGEFVVVQDADLEYDPRDIPAVLVPLANGTADVVFGSRFIGDVRHDKSMIHRIGNWVLTAGSNFFTGIHLTDMETCYKAFRRTALKDLTIVQNRFGVEPEVTAKLARQGFRFAEVPIRYEARSYAEGKKIGVKDLFKAFYCIVRYGVKD
jgi:glycosyltransferase involved in cell wall biosynthesis